MFTNPTVAKRNQLTGPGAWESTWECTRTSASESASQLIGSRCRHLFNHFLFQPDSDYGVAAPLPCWRFPFEGDPKHATTGAHSPDDVTTNPDFGASSKPLARKRKRSTQDSFATQNHLLECDSLRGRLPSMAKEMCWALLRTRDK